MENVYGKDVILEVKDIVELEIFVSSTDCKPDTEYAVTTPCYVVKIPAAPKLQDVLNIYLERGSYLRGLSASRNLQAVAEGKPASTKAGKPSRDFSTLETVEL